MGRCCSRKAPARRNTKPGSILPSPVADSGCTRAGHS
jgi:hypothetical protein